ncbi:hypothetical protein [Microcystis phage MinS1]|nr:hypothetical protein [Microcystis phage MinS1]
MATNLHRVNVTRMEAGNGFLITCAHHDCGFRHVRAFRHEADELAADHQRNQATSWKEGA